MPRQIFRIRFPSLQLALCAFLLLGILTGCGRGPEAVLMGKWVGHHDSESARFIRKTQDEFELAKESGKDLPEVKANPETDSTKRKQPLTDLEQADFEIELNFKSGKKIEMTQGGANRINGTWQVVSNTPSRIVLEIRTPKGSSSKASAKASGKKSKKSDDMLRRWVVRLEGVKQNRFTLVEEGADPEVGIILFKKTST